MKSLIAENEIKRKQVLFCFSMPTGALQLPLNQKSFIVVAWKKSFDE